MDVFLPATADVNEVVNLLRRDLLFDGNFAVHVCLLGLAVLFRMLNLISFAKCLIFIVFSSSGAAGAGAAGPGAGKGDGRRG